MRTLERLLGDSLVPLAVTAICGIGLIVAGQLGPDGRATKRQVSAPGAASLTASIGAPGIRDWSARLRQKWQPQPDAAEPLTRIGFGSCLHQKYPQPIWKSVIATKPQTFVMMGDNVYGDVKSPDMRELVNAYADQAVHPDFAAARARIPMLATWDDHDYGRNDGGAEFDKRVAAGHIFRIFWKGSGTLEGSRGPGIAYSRSFGPEGKRVQLIMLDTRSFRSALQRRASRDEGPGRGKYRPDGDPTKTLLGSDQWAWLEARLREPTELRIIVSGIQVLADGHGWERWGNLPMERQKLFDLIRSTEAKGVIFASGDRHRAAIYRNPGAGPYPLYELTSSSLNRAFDDPAEVGPFQLDRMYGKANFGILEIDWEAGQVELAIRGPDGAPVRSQRVRLSELAGGS